ncbi:MAG TPA: amidohydrolase, partial [Vicinamibacteria bacterium]|nr:amidohydrolase [Vicinamibacteria bacterium]
MILVGARWVVPGEGAPIRDGLVAVREGRIAWVGSRLDPGPPDAPVRHLGDGILLPGPVNAHCHLELSHLAGRVHAADGLVAWVADLVARREEAGMDAVVPSAERAV